MGYEVTNKPKFSLQISSVGYQNLIKNTLGDKKLAQQFVADISTVVGNNDRLQQCDAASIVSGGLTAYTLHLPMSPTLGYCYLIPYGNKAQFQIGWKGLLQLAIRTEKYTAIGTNAVRESEYLGVDKRTREPLIEFKNAVDLDEKIVGYMAYFDMCNGFTKTWYMSTEEIEAHAKKYSKSYVSGKGTNVWRDDFDGMAQKTVLKQLLSKYGLLSPEMQKAIQYDQAVVDENGNPEYVDTPSEEEKEVKTISDDDAKQLFELAKEHGGVNKVKQVMLEFGYKDDTPSNEIKEEDYNAICEKITSDEVIESA